MSNSIYITNTSDNEDIVEVFINNITPNPYTIPGLSSPDLQDIVVLTNKITGTVRVSDITYTKAKTYSNTVNIVVSNPQLIQSLDLLSDFKTNLPRPINLNMNNINYLIKAFIVINYIKYYCLETL